MPEPAVVDVTDYRGTTTIDAAGHAVLPGFVDAHTHVVFGGSRVKEYAATVAGLPVPYDAIRGITGTAEATRSLSPGELAAQAEPRLVEMLHHGTTTVESKSGYGLQVQAEHRILLANRLLDQQLPLEVVSTYLAAHAFPPNIEPDTFDLAQTRRILGAGNLRRKGEAAPGLRAMTSKVRNQPRRCQLLQLVTSRLGFCTWWSDRSPRRLSLSWAIPEPERLHIGSTGQHMGGKSRGTTLAHIDRRKESL